MSSDQQQEIENLKTQYDELVKIRNNGLIWSEHGEDELEDIHDKIIRLQKDYHGE